MRILKGIWQFLVGVKDALALVLLLFIFLGVFAAVRGGRPAVTVPAGSALVLTLDGYVVDQAPEQDPLAALTMGDVQRQIQVRDVIRAVDTAATDDRIKALVLDLDGFLGAGQANLQSMGEALARFKRAGKPVHTYATAYIDDSYYLGAHGSDIWVNPLGALLLSGPGGANLYFGDALKKLDVDVEVFRVGTFKSAVEPFTRNEASPEARAANQALVDALWDSYTADVRKMRPRADPDAWLANLPARVQAGGGDFARTAQAAGFVDRIGTRDEFAAMVAKLVGTGDSDAPGSFNGIDAGDYLAASKPIAASGPAVGVVYVSGEIVDGEAPRGVAAGDTVSQQIRDALENDDIKALVVRVDSPGGSVTASEQIRAALMAAKADGLPVVASFGPVAASGGYWIATAADEIYAQPTTITGSIGVFAVLPTFDRALGGLGINGDGVKSTPYSGEPDLLNGISPDTRQLLQLSVEDIYRRFTGLVASARKLTPARVDEIGQGRVWAGGTAQQLKLVDHFGGLDAAVAAAAKRAGLDAKAVRTIDIERQPSFSYQLLASLFETNEVPAPQGRDAFAVLAARAQARNLAALSEAVRLAQAPTMQARCVSCALHRPPVALTDGERVIIQFLR